MAEEIEVFPFPVRRWVAEGTAVQSVSQNPFTLKTRVVDWGSQALVVAVELPPMKAEEGRAFTAWLAARNGVAGTFRVRPPNWLVQKRNAGAVRVDGADQSGNTIAVTGCVANSAAAIEAGMWVSIGDRLYLVTGNLVTDAEGKGSLAVFPAAAGGEAEDAEIVEWRNPSGVFRLAQAGTAADWGPGQVMEVTGLRFVEAR